jgi:uroporphyrinogen decarboxylase
MQNKGDDVNMNSKERLLAVLGGQLPDRVPVSPFVQEEFLTYLYPGRKADRVVDAVECARYFDFDVMTRSLVFNTPHFMKKSFPNWEVRRSEERSDGKYYQIFEIRTPERTLKQVEAGPDVGLAMAGVHLSTTEFLIKDQADMEAFIKYVPGIDRETVAEMKEYCDWSKGIIGDLGISVPWTWGGIYNQASRLRGMEPLMMDPYLDPDLYEAYMNRITDLAVEFGGELALANGEAIGMQGNVANAGLIGQKFFDANILPYEKRLVDAIHETGTFTVYHNCGRAVSLLPSYRLLGMTAWETVAESPQGDNDLAQAKQMVGERITLIGNLDQVNFLKTASPAEVEERTRNLVTIGKPGGRYIFACSDYLEPNTPHENISAMIKAAKLVGRY